MTAQEIKVSTKAFRKVHGHEPRGRFLWTFRIGVGEKLYIADNGKTYPLYNTIRGEYEECLAKAIRCAEEKGAKTISVSSTVYGQDEESELDEETRLDEQRRLEDDEEGKNW